MAVREILKLPDKRLRLHSEPVKRPDAGIRALVDDMFETMYAAPGIGLAAIQVASPTRRGHGPVEKGRRAQAAGFHRSGNHLGVGRKIDPRGRLLSIPEFYEEVERPSEIKVKFLDLDGKSHEITAKGLFATCFQHEIDHINGVLFIDHISKLKRDRIIKKFTKAAKAAGKNEEKVEA